MAHWVRWFTDGDVPVRYVILPEDIEGFDGKVSNMGRWEIWLHEIDWLHIRDLQHYPTVFMLLRIPHDSLSFLGHMFPMSRLFHYVSVPSPLLRNAPSLSSPIICWLRSPLAEVYYHAPRKVAYHQIMNDIWALFIIVNPAKVVGFMVKMKLAYYWW